MSAIPAKLEALMGRSLAWDVAKDLGGAAFDVVPDESRPDATLPFTVIRVNNDHSAPHMIQFTMSFRGPAAPLLAQRTYRFRHAALGEFAIFVTPIARSAQSTDYEACFSHAP